MSEQEHNSEGEDKHVEDTQEEEEGGMPEDALLVDTLEEEEESSGFSDCNLSSYLHSVRESPCNPPLILK